MIKLKNKKNIGNLLKESQTSKKKNKFAIFGLISDILGLFFCMISIIFFRVGGTGIFLLIGFSLLFLGLILGIIGSRREPRVRFPIFVFIIIPIWFIIMFSIIYFVKNKSLTNNITRRGWFGFFGLGIILGIIELYKVDSKIFEIFLKSLFLIIPLILVILNILISIFNNYI